MTPTLQTTVRAHREALGLSQAALGARVGVSRQAILAIEAGRQVPSTALALQLSRALGCRVEDLFSLPPSTPTAMVSEPLSIGQRVHLGRVDGRWVAHRVADATAGADGIVRQLVGEQAELELLLPEERIARTVLVAGCAPLLGALGHHVQDRFADARLAWVPAGSQRALELLARGRVHVAGLHLAAADAPNTHVELLEQRLPTGRWLLVHLVRWRQGLLVAAGNPTAIREGADLQRSGLRLASREAGAGATKLAQRLLDGAPMPEGPVAAGHAEVAQLVRVGAADVGVAIESEALAAGLDFVPLTEERFDLVLPAALAEAGPVRRLLDVLTTRGWRSDVAALPGYDGSAVGHTLEVGA